MHDCIFEYLPAEIVPPPAYAVRCRCHEDVYRAVFPIDPQHICPVSGQVAPPKQG